MMLTFSQTAAVILAAGTSSRMGQGRNKLLLPLGGKPVLAHVLEAALASRAHPVILVLGHQAPEVRAQLQTYLSVPELLLLENPDFALGQSTSMQAGLRNLLALPEAQRPQGVLFLLGDQPLITPDLLDALIDLRARSGKRIILPLYNGQRGNPVSFSLDLAPELLQVSGDEGGRGLLKRHPNEIATLEVAETTAHFDVDTWEAYQRVLASFKK